MRKILFLSAALVSALSAGAARADLIPTFVSYSAGPTATTFTYSVSLVAGTNEAIYSPTTGANAGQQTKIGISLPASGSQFPTGDTLLGSTLVSTTGWLSNFTFSSSLYGFNLTCATSTAWCNTAETPTTTATFTVSVPYGNLTTQDGGSYYDTAGNDLNLSGSLITAQGAIQVPGPDPDPVPEPASLALLGVGLLGTLSFRKRFMKG